MADLNTQHMIDEVRGNAQTGDTMKTKLVLAHLGDVDTKTQRRLIYELSRGDAKFVVEILLHLISEQNDIVEKLPIVQETLLSNLLAYPEVLGEFLSDPAVKNKNPLIHVAGELRFEEAVPVLLDLAATSKDEEEIILIISSLGLIGDPQAINMLTDYLYAANRELIISAIKALGQVGTQSAMNRLAERMGTDNEIDYMILSIFADVQDPVSLDKLNETLSSHYAHMRIFAKQELVRIGAKSVPALIDNLLQDDPDFIIHTLNVLGDIGDESAVMPIRKLLEKEPKNANVRFAAYEALALLPLRKGAYTLTAGLTDPEDHVCVAAARAIEKNYSKVLTAGIKNLLRNKDDDARHIAKIFVNAQVDKIFLSLVDEEFFQELALIYLPHTHKDTRTHYAKLLADNGLKNFAKKINGDEDVEDKTKIVAVDDSRMILSIYKATLHELGFEPVLFEFPATAIEWLQKEKPAMVLTDLNMPDISGVQLAAEIRKKYSSTELPIIMVTTQNEANDNEAAHKAGIDKIIQKPFNVKSLQAAMEEYL